MKAGQVKHMASRALDELALAMDDGHSESLKAYLVMMARFHRYSAYNTLLINLQCPGATQVAGFGTWRRLGRHVRKGQKAIRILAPVVQRVDSEEAEEESKEQGEVLAYKAAYVFDISQTDGQDLPDLAKASGEPGEYLKALESFIARKGIRLERTARLGSALGASAGGRIFLRADLDGAEEFSTLVHEVAHAMLHRQEGAETDRTVRETEAEAVAFVVSEAIGLEARQAGADYIRLYNGGKKTLLASLVRIRRTAVEIIQGIERPGGTVQEGASQPELQAAAA